MKRFIVGVCALFIATGVFAQYAGWIEQTTPAPGETRTDHRVVITNDTYTYWRLYGGSAITSSTFTTGANGGVATSKSFMWRGNDDIGYQAIIRNEGAGHGLLLSSASTAATTEVLSVESNNASRLTVRGNGRVGINSTSPSTSLVINDPGSAASVATITRTGTTGAVTLYMANKDQSAIAFDETVTADESPIPYSNWHAGSATTAMIAKLGTTLQILGSNSNTVGGTVLQHPIMTVNLLDDSVTFAGKVTATQVIGATYQDVAEWVPSRERLTPGTVVVINPEKHNEVMPSHDAYSTAVAGVVSAQPGVILGIEASDKSQIATTGRVKVHVDATKHPVKAGDLLVSGEKPGTAMPSEPVEFGGVKMHRPGTLIGKALESLPSGEGDILVLLSLQ